MVKEPLFRVPSSSLEELKKIIRGYYHFSGKEISLDELSKFLSINKTTISPNNPFLSEVGLIEGRKKKRCTDLGDRLGRALEHEQEDDVKTQWREVVEGSEFLSNLVSTVRIKKSMTPDDLAGHVLYAADLKKTKPNETGARSVVEILSEAELLKEQDGTLRVAKPSGDIAGQAVAAANGPSQEKLPTSSSVGVPNKVAKFTYPSININIQLELPESEKPDVYENLFKALRRYLLEPDGE